jgi:hypothetical protein
MVDPVDPNSIPMLTDVMVPGRPAMGRPAETPAAAQAQPQPAAAEASPEQATHTPAHTPVVADVSQSTPIPADATVDPPARSSAVSAEPAAGPQPAFDARDIEFIAERLRARFSTYLRRDARGVIEAHCRDAIEEHTNWLVRQVTREVLGALEQEVAGWVRDAVSEELARHTSR